MPIERYKPAYYLGEMSHFQPDIFPVRASETVQWAGVDLLCARRGSQPAGAQCCPDQSGQTAGCARGEDQVCQGKVGPGSCRQERSKIEAVLCSELRLISVGMFQSKT